MDTETPVKDQKELKKHYSDAIAFLDHRYAYFLTYILGIGRPLWTNAIMTAAVQMQEREDDDVDENDEPYDFNFLFSPKFASQLSVEGMAFILAHETLHIVLNHLRLVDNFVDRRPLKQLAERHQKGERLSKQDYTDLIKGQQAAGKFNIAADCVINDYLVESGMPDDDFYNNPSSPLYNSEMPDGLPFLCRGEDKIGENAAYLTVSDVYERLEDQAKQKKQQKQKGQAGGSGQPGGQSEPGEDEPSDEDGRGAQAIDSHDWLLDPDFAEEMADAIDKMNEELENTGQVPIDLIEKKEEEETGTTQAQQKLQQSMRPGSEDGNIKEFMGATGAKLGWVKLMKQLDPDMFKEPGIAPPPAPKWHMRPRKLAGMPSSVVLPVREKSRREKESREKPAIVIALDVSYSIGPKDADRFIELAKSIPQERVKLFCCTFNTSYSAIDDIQQDSKFNIGGGTDFDAIPGYIENVVRPELKGKYPKAVVVITDGEAGMSIRPDEKEAEGWYWLISPSDRSNSTSMNASRVIGRRDKLEEYIL